MVQIYRDYTSFTQDFTSSIYQSDSIKNSQCYEAFETKTVKALDKHAPQKSTISKREA